MSNHRTKGEMGGVRRLLTGLLVATLSFFALMLVTALIRYLGADPTYKSELWSFGAMLLSGALAGFINARMRGDGGVITALLSALALILILFIIGTVAYGVPALPTLVNYAIYVAISGIAAFFGTRKPQRRRH